MYRLFIVEDDPGIANAVAAQAQAWNLQTHIVQNFSNVMHEFAEFSPHIVLLDIMLPEEDAIEKAINQCMEENVLRDFLAQHREEVMHVMTLDYTFERRLEMQRAEAIEDGERIGKEIGKEEKLSEQIRKKIQKGKPLDQIADELEEVPETIRPLYEKIKQEMLQ